MTDPLVQVEGISKRYRRGAKEVLALREVGFAIYPGELVALVVPQALGQQQRAAVACALVLEPRLVFADEPSAHQDSVWVRDVFSQLRAVAEAEAACLVATHDPDALRFADRILALEDGRLCEVAA